MRLALFQPDIPQNLGGAIRLAACLGLGLEVIEPCAFPLGDRAMKRAALDYGPLAKAIRHDGWSAFLADPARKEGRLVLFTTRSSDTLHGFSFQAGDTLLFGQESSGAPEHVHAAAQARLLIPIRPGARSLNLVSACAIAAAEALRQINAFPTPAA
jgi:tRNA (cytidine/uridine-2'-O-)-methyltransferase